MIFDTVMKYYKQLGHKELYFSSYLSSKKNKLLNKIAIDELMNELPYNKSTFSHICSLANSELKRKMNIGIYNPYFVINDTSPYSRIIKSDYIRFLLHHTRMLLIIENIQNIDEVSTKYLLDWINETKDKKHGFILEYTISDDYDVNSIKEFQRLISITGAQVFECELKKMPVEYIADVIDSQLENHSTDINFNINARKHYLETSNGNLWDLIDFARVYDSKENSEVCNTPTLTILKKLSQEAQYLLSIVACHNGTIENELLQHIWENYFSNKSSDFFYKIRNELLSSNTIIISEANDIERLSVSHASILDVWQSNEIYFKSINKDTYNRLKNFYEENYSGNIHIVTKQSAWQMLYFTTKYRKLA